MNWLIKPFTMAVSGGAVLRGVFAPFIAPADAQQYIAGLILLGAAPCTAMVFVWSQLTRGDATYTLVQVSVNDLIMVVAFAPIVAFLLGRDRHRGAVGDAGAVDGALRHAAAVAGLTRHATPRLGERGAAADRGVHRADQAVSVIGLIATVAILFGLQGETILRPRWSSR